jgi:hypothetical protein
LVLHGQFCRSCLRLVPDICCIPTENRMKTFMTQRCHDMSFLHKTSSNVLVDRDTFLTATPQMGQGTSLLQAISRSIKEIQNWQWRWFGAVAGNWDWRSRPGPCHRGCIKTTDCPPCRCCPWWKVNIKLGRLKLLQTRTWCVEQASETVGKNRLSVDRYAATVLEWVSLLLCSSVGFRGAAPNSPPCGCGAEIFWNKDCQIMQFFTQIYSIKTLFSIFFSNHT